MTPEGLREALVALRLLAGCHMQDATSREWGNRTLVEAAFVCDDDDRDGVISAVWNFGEAASALVAEVERCWRLLDACDADVHAAIYHVERGDVGKALELFGVEEVTP
jgi:hypothetical protein